MQLHPLSYSDPSNTVRSWNFFLAKVQFLIFLPCLEKEHPKLKGRQFLVANFKSEYNSSETILLKINNVYKVKCRVRAA
jgi:hypothetical protein